MADAEQRFLELWSTDKARVALWADSSYGPLEEKDILKMARELNFPVSSFNCSFGGGLTAKGDFHDPAGKPEEIVLIEMGYNDESNMSAQDVAFKMRRQQWYRVLSQSASVVKFVIFVEQPSYRQVCPPKKKNSFNAGWTRGAKLEGSKYTEQAIQLCQELGVLAFCWEIQSAQELWANMLVHEDGELWQNEAVSRCADRCTKRSLDYGPDGRLALWEDSWHPTAPGAQLHFRCLVKAFQDRFGAFGGAAQLASSSPAPLKVLPLKPKASSFSAASSSAVNRVRGALAAGGHSSTSESASPAEASLQSRQAYYRQLRLGQARSQPY